MLILQITISLNTDLHEVPLQHPSSYPLSAESSGQPAASQQQRKREVNRWFLVCSGKSYARHIFPTNCFQSIQAADLYPLSEYQAAEQAVLVDQNNNRPACKQGDSQIGQQNDQPLHRLELRLGLCLKQIQHQIMHQVDFQ